MKIGVVILSSRGLNDVIEHIKAAKSYGLASFQLICYDPQFMTEQNATAIRAAADECGLEISALWCGWQGPMHWNFVDGPLDLGIVPLYWRDMRISNLKCGSDFAKMLGVSDVATHMGFLPENPKTPEFESVVKAIRELAEYVKANGQNLLFETGQETPITLLRTILAVGTGNLYINFDPANLLLYGKANPVDALDIFGKYVRGVHGKDGEYPTNPDFLGEEKRIGDGRANFPKLIAKLKALGYDGSITIEREISGEKQVEDILYAKKFLEDLING